MRDNQDKVEEFRKKNQHRLNTKSEYQPKNAFKLWSREEETRLTTYFKAHIKPHKIAEFFERSQLAIEFRLVHLGLWDSDGKETVDAEFVKPYQYAVYHPQLTRRQRGLLT